MTKKQWKVLETPPETFTIECGEFPPLIQKLLWNRGLQTSEQIHEFLHPKYEEHIHDPFLFRDMERAVERLFQAIADKEKIVIHGDYDADGISGSVILTTALKALGAQTDIFIPHRENDGYGLNLRTVNLLAQQGIRILITCDCGISNREEIAVASANGIDVIITDHHQEPPLLPDTAYAILHPKIAGETYPDKGLSGGGVAFKLVQGLLREFEKQHPGSLLDGMTPGTFEKWLLDMVAISSVADMVPLIGETRTLVRYGLLVLEKTKRIGLHHILQRAGVYDENGHIKRSGLDAHTIGFRIAPRINAAGRMNHANTSFNLLISKEDTEAQRLSEELEQNNSERQQITERFVKEAIEMIEQEGSKQPALILVHKEGWSPGVIGLIASKLKDIYYRPAIAIAKTAEGIYVGSGRSISEFHLTNALQEIPHFFTKFGGHPQACGFSLQENVDYLVFKQAFTDIAERELTGRELAPTLEIEAETLLSDIDWKTYEFLSTLEPFGIGNSEPRYVARNLTIVNMQSLGANGQHLKLFVRQGTEGTIRKAIGFFCGEWKEALHIGDSIDMVFEVGVNEWNGNRELQIKIIDWKKSTI